MTSPTNVSVSVLFYKIKTTPMIPHYCTYIFCVALIERPPSGRNDILRIQSSHEVKTNV